MFIDFQTTSKSMTLSKLPLWQTPEQVCDILLALPVEPSSSPCGVFSDFGIVLLQFDFLCTTVTNGRC